MKLDTKAFMGMLQAQKEHGARVERLNALTAQVKEFQCNLSLAQEELLGMMLSCEICDAQDKLNVLYDGLAYFVKRLEKTNADYLRDMEDELTPADANFDWTLGTTALENRGEWTDDWSYLDDAE